MEDGWEVEEGWSEDGEDDDGEDEEEDEGGGDEECTIEGALLIGSLESIKESGEFLLFNKRNGNQGNVTLSQMLRYKAHHFQQLFFFPLLTYYLYTNRHTSNFLRFI